MKANIIKQRNSEDIRKIEITTNNSDFTITETIDGKLSIQKNDSEDGNISIFPRVSNVIDII